MEIKYNLHATNILYSASGHSVRESKEKYSYTQEYTLLENEVHFSILLKKEYLLQKKMYFKRIHFRVNWMQCLQHLYVGCETLQAKTVFSCTCQFWDFGLFGFS